jgi:hypothetical protein
MSRVPFADLPGHARLWCFGASRPLEDAEVERLTTAMETFVTDWTAHGARLRAGVDVQESRFLLVAVDESASSSSGCSRDALMRCVAGLETELGVDLLDTAPVWYRAGEREVRSVPRERFRELAAEGAVGPETPVFDLTASRVEDLSAGRFERRAAATWHAALL